MSATASSPPAGAAARIFGLDLLRAAAILSVLFAHLFAVLYPHVPWLGLLGHGGFFGVELFFVLSGFLIGQILIREGAELGRGAAVSFVHMFFVRNARKFTSSLLNGSFDVFFWHVYVFCFFDKST